MINKNSLIVHPIFISYFRFMVLGDPCISTLADHWYLMVDRTAAMRFGWQGDGEASLAMTLSQGFVPHREDHKPSPATTTLTGGLVLSPLHLVVCRCTRGPTSGPSYDVTLLKT